MRTIVLLILVTPWLAAARTAIDSTYAETPDGLSLLLFDDLTSPEAAELIPETISDLLSRPYDLSHPDERILQLIPTLTELEAMKVRMLKNATTEDEMRRILTNKLYDRSRPFLSIATVPQHTIETRSRISMDPNDENEEEYVEGKYDGSSLKSSNLVRLYSGNITAGLVQSKDAGEPLFLDHVGGYCSIMRPIELSGSLAIRNAVVGDYSVGYGEGLILVRGYARSKSADAISPLGINATGIGNYLSTSAYRFYRGAATSLQFHELSLDLFYSNRLIDATVSDSGTVTSLSYTGYHRTSSEQDRRLSTKQIVNGANISYTIFDTDDARLTMSATGYLLSYDRNVINTDTLKTRFRGDRLSAGSVSAALLYDNYSLRSEFAYSGSDDAQANAITATLLARPLERWEFAANIRILPEEFLSPLGGTFGDNTSDVQNEKGGYLGIRTSPTDALTLEGYVDLSSRIERTPTNENVLSTRDLRFSGSWSKFESPLRLSLETRFRTREDLTAVRSDTVEPHDKLNVKLRPDYRFSDKLRIALHTEFARYVEPDIEASNGYLAGTIVYYRPWEILDIALSTYLYATDSYDSRIYISEPEVPSVSGFNFLYGDGFRYSVRVGAKPFDALQLFAKFSESRFYSPSTEQRESRVYMTFQAELKL